MEDKIGKPLREASKTHAKTPLSRAAWVSWTLVDTYSNTSHLGHVIAFPSMYFGSTDRDRLTRPITSDSIPLPHSCACELKDMHMKDWPQVLKWLCLMNYSAAYRAALVHLEVLHNTYLADWKLYTHNYDTHLTSTLAQTILASKVCYGWDLCLGVWTQLIVSGSRWFWAPCLVSVHFSWRISRCKLARASVLQLKHLQ